MAPGIVNFVVGWLPLPLDEAIRLQDLISNLGQISYIAAGFFAAALILAFEHARDVRMSGQADTQAPDLDVSLADRLAGRTAPGPTTSWTSAQPGATPWPERGARRASPGRPHQVTRCRGPALRPARPTRARPTG